MPAGTPQGDGRSYGDIRRGGVNFNGKEMMMYFQGFVVPAKTEKKPAYLDIAKKAAPVFAEYGAEGIIECWGDDVMDGKITDLRKAVQANDDETVVFSWIWWPDKATCDAASEKIMKDDRMRPDGPMPFDGNRMIYAGFEAAYDTGDAGRFGYIDAMVASVPNGNRQAFIDHAARTATLFGQKGALRVVNGWGADVPDGKVTDFKRAVQATSGETVVFGWIEWPDKPTRDAGMGALMQDQRMRETPPAWNGKLAIFGGFAPILDTGHA
jgi:uncharacterized protein YbaA (DUF1428 family)